MTAVEYSVRQALASLWRARGASLFATVAIALAVLVLGAVVLVGWNAERWLVARMATAELSVFLRDGVTSEEREGVERVLARSGVAQSQVYVSKAEALSRFRTAFRDLAALAEEFDDNPSPASVEARLATGSVAQARVDAVVTDLARTPGVVDVRYDREWLARLSHGVATLQVAGGTLAILLALAAAVTVGTVVRLGLYARRAELEIMNLVGAPVAFIRGPFVAEGVAQGGLGACVAVVLLWVGYSVALRWWGTTLVTVLEGATVAFLPWTVCLVLVLGGMLLGAVGGFVASRHAGRA